MSAPGLGAGVRRFSRTRLALGVLVAALVVGWGLTRVFGGGEEINWIDVGADDLVLTVEVEGTLASHDASIVTPPQVGEVWEFQLRYMAPEGSEIASGEPLLAFDTSQLDQQLLQLQTEAQQAAKNIEKLDVDLEQELLGMDLELAEAAAQSRRAGLKDDVPADLRSMNQAELDGLDVELATLEVGSLEGRIAAAGESGAARRSALVAQRDRAQRLVRDTERAIARMIVMAPRSGTVIYISNWRGEKKKVGDQVWRRERIIELPDLNTMMAKGEVDESDAGRIAEGQTVTMRLDAHPDVMYQANIESIWRTVQRKSFSRNPIKVVRLDLNLSETDVERMRPGMRFRGTIETGRVEGALVVPTHVVFPTDGGPVVYRKTVFGSEEVPVELGRRNAELLEVLAGLRAGDRISERNLGR
jgi:HlyD family secretion protein